METRLTIWWRGMPEPNDVEGCNKLKDRFSVFREDLASVFSSGLKKRKFKEGPDVCRSSERQARKIV